MVNGRWREEEQHFLLSSAFEMSFFSTPTAEASRVLHFCVVVREERARFSINTNTFSHFVSHRERDIGRTHSTRPFVGVHTMGRALTFLANPFHQHYPLSFLSFIGRHLSSLPLAHLFDDKQRSESQRALLGRRLIGSTRDHEAVNTALVGCDTLQPPPDNRF